MQFASVGVFAACVLGLVVGSFLNVVIYRLPRGLSVGRPRWSMCPACKARIRPAHNVPVLSWLFLRGRCASCGAAIPVSYPLVEILCAIVFVLLWDAFFAARLAPRGGTGAAALPEFVAYSALFAGLLAASVMDVEHYIVDIRICYTVMAIGVVAGGVAGPRWVWDADAAGAGRLPPSICVAAVAAGLIWVALVCIAGLISRNRQSNDGLTTSSQTEAAPRDEAATAPAPPQRGVGAPEFRPAVIVALAMVLVALIVWQSVAPERGRWGGLSPGYWRALAGFSVLNTALILSSMVRRESDEVVYGEIEDTRGAARSMVLREAVWLLPSVAGALLVFLRLRGSGQVGATWPDLLAPLAMGSGPAAHVGGALQAGAALILAAGLGWAVRVLGTLCFGKEAFGTGDIFIMAAIAAVGGFWSVVFAFFIAAVLALFGVLATLVRKTQRAVPFGPWLALAAFCEVWLERPLLDVCGPAGALLWSLVSGQPVL